MFQFPVGGGDCILYCHVQTICRLSAGWLVLESEVDNTSFYSAETIMFLCDVLSLPLYALMV